MACCPGWRQEVSAPLDLWVLPDPVDRRLKGMDAMANGRATSSPQGAGGQTSGRYTPGVSSASAISGDARDELSSLLGRTKHRSPIAHLWQLPLFVISILLFGYAAYRFIDPRPAMTLAEKVDVARILVQEHRPEAAIDYLNKLLVTDGLEPAMQADVHLMLAESLEEGQQQKRISLATNHLQIIEHTRLALRLGVKPTGQIHRRLGTSYEAIDKPVEALSNYRQAMMLDPKLEPALLRKVAELQLDQNQVGPAEESLASYLGLPGLSDSERVWAIGRKAQILVDRGSFLEAQTLLSDALGLATEKVTQGELNYWLGYCHWKLGEDAEAERLIRVARDQLTVRSDLDGDACYVLGRILQSRQDAAGAISFYEIAMTSHPNSKLMPGVRLGRGICRIMLSQDEPGMNDLQTLTLELLDKPSKAKFKSEAIDGLRLAESLLTARGNLKSTLELMNYEQELDPDPPAGFFARLAMVFEKRADQLDQTLGTMKMADRLHAVQEARDSRVKAGDALVAYSRLLTVVDDKKYGEAMWHGIDLYEQAGDNHRVISGLELFAAERPDDKLTPDALLRLGRTYQAMGQLDKAIAAYQRNQFRYGKTLAASKSAVPLAQAYLAQGPDAYGKAESVLKMVIQDNPQITPEAEEFRSALLELGQLYYRTGRYEEAIVRMEEWTQRYPDDLRVQQLLFLMADAYRKSAGLLNVKLATADPKAGAVDASEASTARVQRLNKAKGLYDRVIDISRDTEPADALQKLYVKLSYFYRADCLYDLGQYEQAIKLYDAAAFRYQNDPSALAAYVQIVNAYCALGRLEEAKTANERAKVVLRRMPPEAFQDGSFSMPKAYWEQWLKWTSEAGMW